MRVRERFTVTALVINWSALQPLQFEAESDFKKEKVAFLSEKTKTQNQNPSDKYRKYNAIKVIAMLQLSRLTLPWIRRDCSCQSLSGWENIPYNFLQMWINLIDFTSILRNYLSCILFWYLSLELSHMTQMWLLLGSS